MNVTCLKLLYTNHINAYVMGEILMKVAVYTRVSTDSENQLNSLGNQQKHYVEFCNRNEYELQHMYVDEGLTGTKLKREAFVNMLYDAGLNIIEDQEGVRFRVTKREPKFDYIITKDVSRFSRTMNAIQVIDALREKNVYVLFEQNNIDTKDEKSDFMLNLFLSFASQESQDRSIKVKFGLKQRAKEGKYHFGSERMYGYNYDKEKKDFTVIEEEADVVRRIFDLYVNKGLGSRKIADTLNEDGITTHNGHLWNANGVVRTLKQEKYTGRVALQMYTYGSIKKEVRSLKKRDENEWFYHDDILPGIISQEEFKQAQDIMSSRSKVRGVNTPTNMFSKKLKCAKCGKNYIRTNQKQQGKTYYFYACATRRRTKQCDNHSVSLLKLERELEVYQSYKLYQYLVEQQNGVNQMLQSNIRALNIKKKFADKRKDVLLRQIQEKMEETDNLVESFLTASDTVKKVVERKIEKLENERQSLEAELLSFEPEQLDAEIQNCKDEMDHINRVIEKKKQFTQDEVMEYVDNIIIDGDNIEFKFNFLKILPNSDVETIMEHIQQNMKNINSIVDDFTDKVFFTDITKHLDT